MASRRLEDRIREKCAQAVASTDSAELSLVFEELRTLLREHAERLRVVAGAKLSAGVPVVKRRTP